MPTTAWRPTAADLKPLGATGRRWIRRLLAEFDVTPAEGTVALLAAAALDRLDKLQAVKDEDLPTPKARQAHEAMVLRWSKFVASCAAQLRVPR